MKALIDLLKEFNWEEKEIEIFCFLMEFGEQPASIIAKNINMQRSTIYWKLEKMANDGYLAKQIKNSLGYFAAVKVEVLIEQMRRKQQSLALKMEDVQLELAEQRIQAMGVNIKSSAQYVTGKSGLLKILDDILVEKPEMLRAFMCSDFNDFINEYAPDFPDRRLRKGIKAKAIHPSILKPGETWNSCPEKIRQSKQLSSLFDIGIAFLGYGNKSAIISSKEEFGLVVESESISTAQAKLFDFGWSLARNV